MALDALVDSTQLDADLTSVANAIRTKGGTSAQLAFPADFVQAIGAISGGVTVHKGTFTPAVYSTSAYTITHNLNLTNGYVVYYECDDWQAAIDGSASTTGNKALAAVNVFFSKGGKSLASQKGYHRVFTTSLTVDYASNIIVTKDSFQIKPQMPFKHYYYIVECSDLRGVT